MFTNRLSYLLGLLSLVFIPYFHGIKLVDIVLVVGDFLLLLFLLLKRKYSVRILLTSSLFAIYIIISIMGAIINTESYNGVSVAIRYILLLFSVSLLYFYNRETLLCFKKGFVTIAYITVAWMFVDTIYYYMIHPMTSINEDLFSELIVGNEHRLTNRFKIGSIPLLLRASGFGWDPGGIAPALLIAYIINYYNRFYQYNWILIIGIFLSLSKTTFLALALFVVYLILKKVNMLLAKSMVALFFVFVFVTSASINGKSTDPNNDGNIRHIKYPSSIGYMIDAPISEILLGYGYRGTGEFFFKYPPWFRTHNFLTSYKESQNTIVESSFTNLFLYSGLIGSVIFYSIVFIIFLYGNDEEVAIISFLFIMYVGYTFENLWTNFLIYAIFFEIISRRGIRFGKYHIG